MKNKIFILAFAFMVIFPMLHASAQAYNYEYGIFDKYQFSVTSSGTSNIGAAYDNDSSTFAAFNTTSAFMEFTFDETIDAIYAYYLNSNSSIHIGTIFYDDSNNVLSEIDRMSAEYRVIEPIYNVKKIRVYNSSNLTDRRITELEYFDEPVAIYQNYDLDNIDNHANEANINTFINQYTYVYPVRGVFESNGNTFLNLIGSNDIMNPYYDASENKLYYDLNNTAYLLSSSGGIYPATSSNLNSYLSLTTDAGEPNTANFYFTYPAAAPAAPTGLTAIAGDGEVMLNWIANSEDDLAGYYVYQDGVRITSSLITVTNYTVTGLTNDTSYDFYVTAANTSNIESQPSATVIGMPEGAPDTTPPDAPEGLSATAGDSEVVLTWSANSEDDLAGYYVYQDGVRITSSLITATTYTVSDLINGTSYEFYVTAVDTNDNESLPSGSVTTTPEALPDLTPPAAPEGLTATPLPGRIYLKWQANSEDDLAGYYVYQNDERVNSEPTTKNEMAVTNVVYGEDYTFFVTAIDFDGNESDPTPPVTASPLEDNSVVIPGIGLSAAGIVATATSFISNVLPDWLKLGLGIVIAFVLFDFLMWIMSRIRGEAYMSSPRAFYEFGKKIRMDKEERTRVFMREYRAERKEEKRREQETRAAREERVTRNDIRDLRPVRAGRQGRS